MDIIYVRQYGKLPAGLIPECAPSCGCCKIVSWLYNPKLKKYHVMCENYVGGHWMDSRGIVPPQPKGLFD
jgi:hypothetical protein